MRQSPPRTIEWVVEQHILSRRGSRMVSTRDAIRALRTVMPKCALSGRELTDLIAICAVRRGLDVNFDGIADESGPLQNDSSFNHAPQQHARPGGGDPDRHPR